ncbi:MAG: sulfate ABC transporter substrate-binding protein [Chloroflexota bacterium]
MKRILQMTSAFGLLVFLILSMPQGQAQDAITITLGAYTTPREAYAEIIPLFEAYWLEQSGQQVTFQESYLGSGAQARAVEGGFEADLVALALSNDVTRLVNAGLITHDWTANDYAGILHTSVVSIITRAGNPLGITDWDDLAQPNVEVVAPDAATSGGARWNIVGLYGAALRGQVEGYEASEAGARQLLKDIFANVSVMDAGARESVLTFENGIGDAAITYENEYFAAKLAGADFEIVYPASTILIENPVALVDTYADAHGTREVTEAFIQFLYTPEAQAIFAAHGFRPPVLAAAGDAATPEASAEGALDPAVFPTISDLFTIADFGGWGEVTPLYFGDDGIYNQVIAEIQAGT